ncbi:MAG TPA: D-aminoacyl-tRNA deacylase [Nitrososphaeraceae archaeon]|nr:D-aminoacyl-tRNA deacylase [Nitrososphaeraceae archaeon]
MSNSYFTLVASKKDPASSTMAEYLIDRIGFSKNSQDLNFCGSHDSDCKASVTKDYRTDIFDLYIYKNIKLHFSQNSLLLYLDNLDTIYPDCLAFIFLSRHSSESRIPTLTCHFTGNFDTNRFGGIPRELGMCYPYLQKQYMKEISANRFLVPSYGIVIEATHHGPTSLKKPSLFIEIGSTEKEWADKNAASVVCDSLMYVLHKINANSRCKDVGIALGGTHYPTKFNQLLLNSQFGLAAVAARHNLCSVEESMINQMISKSIEKVEYAIVDRKGLGKEKVRILELIEKKDLQLLEL